MMDTLSHEDQPPMDMRGRIEQMTEKEFRTFCETHPRLHNYFNKSELQTLEDLAFSGGKILTIPVDVWIEMGLPKSTAFALRSFIDTVAPVVPSVVVALGQPQFIVRMQIEEQKWFKRLFHMTKAFKHDSSFYTSMALQKVPLFTPPELRSTRLVMDPDDMCFRYYGRSLFKQLSDKVKDMRAYGGKFLYVHGTTGAGKSHVLAAFAASLVAQGERVVFLADCRMLAPEPINSIRSALCLAFADEDEVISEIMKIKDKDSLQEFCRLIGRRRLIFIIDQVNALDTVADSSYKVIEEQKSFTRTILDIITRYHFKIISATGSYPHGEGGLLGLSEHERLEAHGGLNEIEARGWWENNDLGKKWGKLLQVQHKKDIEVYTGMVPTLLAHFVAAPSDDFALDNIVWEPTDDPTITLQDFVSRTVRDHLIDLVNNSSTAFDWREMMSDFMATQAERVKNTGLDEPFLQTIECCVSESPAADDMIWPLIDHRFMFVAGGIGRCSGGILVRQIATMYLRTRSISLFSGTRWYSTLTGDLNPTVLGFLVKQIALSWIAAHGCEQLYIEASPVMCTFPGPAPPLDFGKQVFAIPTKLDFPLMDACYWELTQRGTPDGTPIVRFIGIQVTLQDWKAHSEAEGPFLEIAEKWTSDRGWAGEWEIVWLVETRKPWQSNQSVVKAETSLEYLARVEASQKKTKKRKLDAEKGVSETSPKIYGRRPSFIRHIITISEVSDRIGAKLNAVRKTNAPQSTVNANVPRPPVSTMSASVSRTAVSTVSPRGSRPPASATPQNKMARRPR